MSVFLWLVGQNEQKELSWNRQNESNGNVHDERKMIFLGFSQGHFFNQENIVFSPRNPPVTQISVSCWSGLYRTCCVQ